jgi:hypothetical protein
MPGNLACRAEWRLHACSHVELHAGTPGAAGERVRQHGIDGPAYIGTKARFCKKESG